MHTILGEVVGLTKEKQDELADLLKQTTLSAIIGASKTVSDRLHFLSGLEGLLFDKETRKSLLERSQLHRLLAANTWIFGEEYNLTVDDESLDAALDRHLEILGRERRCEEPVLREGGQGGILDLMLSRVIPLPHHEQREHLVVELKRPSQTVDQKVLGQIKSYAFAVARDERFRDTNTSWRFVAVSNDLSTDVEQEARQHGRPPGLIHDDSRMNLRIWVHRWGDIIQSASARLKFFQQQLELNVTRASARTHLSEVYAKYVPSSVSQKAEDTSVDNSAAVSRE